MGPIWKFSPEWGSGRGGGGGGAAQILFLFLFCPPGIQVHCHGDTSYIPSYLSRILC